jgi:hypothetical protein
MGDDKNSKDKDEPDLRGLYGAVQSAIWLIGLAILFWTGYWFPGILVLVAISGITQALLASMASRQEQKAAEQAALAASARSAAMAVPPNCPHLRGGCQRRHRHLDRPCHGSLSLLQGGDFAKV